jgi:hypothetical protein
MSLVNFSIQHGRTLPEAKAQLAQTVGEAQGRFGSLLPGVSWSDERDRVLLQGTGFEIEVWVDATQAHLRADIPLLGKLLGSKLIGGLKGLLEHNFTKRLPPA